MFAKVFTQIFDSSIADNFQHRHVFMDLLVLADSDGVIDMTAGAIARRTNVPLEMVQEAITALCAPDPDSRTPGEDGRRLLPVDTARGWGWQIVNYHHYRQIRDEESRREYHRDYRRKERELKRKKKVKKPKPPAGYTPRHVIAPREEDHPKSYVQYQAENGCSAPGKGALTNGRDHQSADSPPIEDASL